MWRECDEDPVQFAEGGEKSALVFLSLTVYAYLQYVSVIRVDVFVELCRGAQTELRRVR